MDRATRKECLAAAENVVARVAGDLRWSDRKVARRYRRGDPQVVAMIAAEAAVEGQKIDPDRLREILQVILDFILAILAAFL